jgi:hypothetical protein
MTSRSDIIRANPIGRELDALRDAHALVLTNEGDIVADDKGTIGVMINQSQSLPEQWMKIPRRNSYLPC